MIFIVHSGPYWTPKIANRVDELIREFGGSFEKLKPLQNGIDADVGPHQLAILAHQAFLDTDPDIRRSRESTEYDDFEQRLIEILRQTRIPTNSFFMPRQAVGC